MASKLNIICNFPGQLCERGGRPNDLLSRDFKKLPPEAFKKQISAIIINLSGKRFPRLEQISSLLLSCQNAFPGYSSETQLSFEIEARPHAAELIANLTEFSPTFFLIALKRLNLEEDSESFDLLAEIFKSWNALNKFHKDTKRGIAFRSLIDSNQLGPSLDCAIKLEVPEISIPFHPLIPYAYEDIAYNPEQILALRKLAKDYLNSNHYTLFPNSSYLTINNTAPYNPRIRFSDHCFVGVGPGAQTRFHNSDDSLISISFSAGYFPLQES